jgi:hypothetical protein
MILNKAMMGAALAAVFVASMVSDAGATSPEATCRKVQGVITAVDANSMTIAPTSKPVVTGQIDARTKVVIDGQQSRPADLRVTYNAKGQLCLDDVWTLVTADSRN